MAKSRMYGKQFLSVQTLLARERQRHKGSPAQGTAAQIEAFFWVYGKERFSVHARFGGDSG